MHHVGTKKKRTWQALLAAFAAIALLAACGEPQAPGGGGTVSAVTITDGDTLALMIGESRTLGVEVTGDASTALTWRTSDASVVSVNDQGRVTAEAAGTATVTATSVVDPSRSDAIRITVAAEAGVVINDGDFQLTVGTSSDPLSVQVVGEGLSDEVTFESSAESFATVDAEGVVTGVAAGTAEITATSVDDPTLTDSVTVTVVEEGGGTSPTPRAEDPAATFDAGSPVVPGSDAIVVTVADRDSDPYYLQGWTPEQPIEGTLRHALATAPSGSVITFAEGIQEVVVSGVDVYDEGNIDAHLIFRQDVTIVGPGNGVTIRVQSAYEAGDPGDPFTYSSRLGFVPAGVDVTMQNVTLTGGTFIFDGGGIRNDGTLTLRDVTVTGNRAWSRGGGIFNQGDLTVIDSVISGNSAVVEDDEVEATFEIRGGPGTADLSDGGYGGGIFNAGSGSLTVYNSNISDNRAKISGAGVYDAGATVDLIRTTVSGNVANEAVADTDGIPGNTTTFANYGGGIYTVGSLAVSNVGFTNNVTTESGGGLYVDRNGAAALWQDVAFDGNGSAFGGGIFHQHDGSARNLTPADPVAASNITFTANTADSPANADYYEQDMSASSLRLLRMEEGQGPGTYPPRP